MKNHTLGLLIFAVLAGCHAKEGNEGAAANQGSGGSCAAIASSCTNNGLACVEGSAGPACQACPAANYVTESAGCQPIPGTPITNVFPDQTTAPGEEELVTCRAWTLNNAEDLWVSAVELTQNELSHHSNWTFVPDTDFPGPDGLFTCADRTYDFYTAVAEGGLLYAQSTQATHEVQHFATGAAIRIPAHSKIMSDSHLLNTSTMSNTGHATLTLYTIPESEVTVALTAFHVEYDALTIPPLAISRFTGACSVASAVSTAQGAPFAPQIYYLLPHTHALASGYTAQILGGPNDGQYLLDLPGYNGEPHGRSFDPPIDMTGADGITFACQYTNTRTMEVGWGFGTNEMCELFGFAQTPDFFQSRVETGVSAGTDSNGVQLFTGSCTTVVYPPPQ
jgi:hypothetical protein